MVDVTLQKRIEWLIWSAISTLLDNCRINIVFSITFFLFFFKQGLIQVLVGTAISVLWNKNVVSSITLILMVKL
jgi:hypothetical protein